MSQQMDLFEQQKVAEGVLTLKAPNAALRKLLKYDPQYLTIGQTTRLVVEAECVGVSFERTDDENIDAPLRRVHVMKLTEAARA